MIRGRIRTGDGREPTGVIEGGLEDGMLHPRAGLRAAAAAGDPEPLAGATQLTPCAPGKFVCLWNNFHAAAEKNGWTPPEHPLFLLKPPTAQSGPGATVTIPEGVRRVTCEGEPGIVIGRACRRSSVEDAAAADMIFDPAAIVSRLSHDMTLLPGDLIACGASLGVRPVKAGGVVAVAIEGIGALRVTMAAAQAAG